MPAQPLSMEHWILLSVFFAIFALCGFMVPRKNSRPAAFYFAMGLLALVVNGVGLALARHLGYQAYSIFDLFTLQQVAIESTLIVFGYCLIVRAVAVFFRNSFSVKPLHRRTLL